MNARCESDVMALFGDQVPGNVRDFGNGIRARRCPGLHFGHAISPSCKNAANMCARRCGDVVTVVAHHDCASRHAPGHGDRVQQVPRVRLAHGKTVATAHCIEPGGEFHDLQDMLCRRHRFVGADRKFPSRAPEA